MEWFAIGVTVALIGCAFGFRWLAGKVRDLSHSDRDARNRDVEAIVRSLTGYVGELGVVWSRDGAGKDIIPVLSKWATFVRNSTSDARTNANDAMTALVMLADKCGYALQYEATSEVTHESGERIATGYEWQLHANPRATTLDSLQRDVIGTTTLHNRKITALADHAGVTLVERDGKVTARRKGKGKSYALEGTAGVEVKIAGNTTKRGRGKR